VKLKGAVVRRDTVQWMAGLGLGIWETVTHPEPRLIVLAFAGVLMGLPGFVGLLQYRSAPPPPISPTGTTSSESPSPQPSSPS
jgi:hypothetical protein